jgi:hypothetical protein
MGTESLPDYADMWWHSASVRSNPTANSCGQGTRRAALAVSRAEEVLLDRDQVSVERAGSLFSFPLFL